MSNRNRKSAKRRSKIDQRGSSLAIIGFTMTILLGLAALAIDLVSFYVARSEAQRSADAAALAGATYWSRSGCASTSAGCASFQAGAMNAAIDMGNQNLVGGASPGIQSSDFSWIYSPVGDPRITVTVKRTSARGNPMPTYFARILGYSTVDVSATATAEAYHPGANGPQVGALCTKPWLLPNCDPSHSGPQTNSLCGTNIAYYVNPDQTINNPSVLGTLITIKPGSPSAATAPSQFFPVILPPGTAPSECPTCSTGGSGGTTGAALYRQNIECCNTRTITCGSISLQPETGDVTGPTAQGVKCLIHEQSNFLGEDILNSYTPLQMTGGTNNPNPALRGQTITSSDSLITVPLYDGAQLCPGQSCPASVTANIVGFMQMFVKDEINPQGTTEAYIMNVSACGGTSGGSSGGVITGGGLLPVPVRLVHP